MIKNKEIKQNWKRGEKIGSEISTVHSPWKVYTFTTKKEEQMQCILTKSTKEI